MATRENTLYNEVKAIMTEKPATRDYDEWLMVAVYEGRGVPPTAPFASTIIRKDLPSFESITRMRRKVQENCPELRPSEWASKKRTRRQKDLFDFLREQKKKQQAPK